MRETSFKAVTLPTLEAMSVDERDGLPYGAVGFGPDTIVQTYDATEARMSGLDPSTVVLVPFFDAAAQCMNNFMVAQRLVDEPMLDDVVPYVLTLRMRPRKVRLRLLADPGMPCRYILIER